MFPFSFVSKWSDDENLFEIAVLLLATFWIVALLFLLCEPDTRMTNPFKMFNDEAGRCDWYALPTDLQRMYLILVSDTQHAVIICSYGGITCERHTLKKVLQAALAKNEK